MYIMVLYIFLKGVIFWKTWYTLLCYFTWSSKASFNKIRQITCKRHNQFKLLILHWAYIIFCYFWVLEWVQKNTNNSNKTDCYMETDWVREKGTSRVLILELKSIILNRILTIMVISKSLRKKKKQSLWPFLWMGFNCCKAREPLRGDSLLFPLISQKLLALIWLTLEGTKAEWALESHSIKLVYI